MGQDHVTQTLAFFFKRTALSLQRGQFLGHAFAACLREAERKAEAVKKSRQAERCWQEALPISGTLVETYLRTARGITCVLPGTLRFHPEAWHGPTATRHPALVALVEGGDGFAVHRTFLRPDGTGKADVDPAKAMLGAVSGGAVRLGAEDVSDLQPGARHPPQTLPGSLSERAAMHCLERFKRAHRVPDRLGRNLGVACCRAQLGLPPRTARSA